MNQKSMHVRLLSLLVFCLCAPVAPMQSHAQSGAGTQDLPTRDQAYIGDLVELSTIIGSAHAVRLRCNGTDDQYWRAYMVQILGLEAPNQSRLRTSMVSGFNRGFEREQRSGRRCDARSNEVEAQYAADGRRISERLAAFYFPKRSD